MTMGRVWIALAAACLLGSASEARAECRPTAIPSGEPTLVVRLSERLAASGIATSAATGCPIARVRVEQRGEQIRVEITDSFGRTGTREVRDVATAATIVESWTSQAIEVGSLPSLVGPAPAPAVVAVAATPWIYGVTAAFDSSAASDGSIWMGGVVTSCVRVGAVCAGMMLRGTSDTVAAGTMIDHDTRELDALATVGLPRRLGGFTITPGIGAGYRWQQITEHHFDAVHMVGFEQARSSHGLVADVHVDATHPLGNHVSIYAAVRGDSAVLRSDSTTGPRSFVHASIGIRLGME